MLAMFQGAIRLTFPITPAEIQITTGNNVDTFSVITGQERTGKPSAKLQRVSFSTILPRGWRELWETDKKQTVTYKRPETTWQLLEKWKPKPVVLNFEELFSQTMLIESMDIVYKDGQGNIHITMTLVEHKPVKIVTYSNTKQLLKPGVIITKASKSRPNTTAKSDKKNKKKSSEKKKKAEAKKKSKAAKENADNAKGAFDYTAQRNKISSALAKPM
ncbi:MULTISPECIES: hypothetical protein [Paenibacillus]|jgi:hypothetical protein|uniref:hypothetical protein n=1 Tax=Paenibacillus TaxID=44249 RepID=UPI00240D32D0|nr:MULTISPECIES: hypothetical protein [Paenibacillus]MCI1776579.1 hypothetical protein [Paenibacillus lautus]WFB57592.1 hypothetical protein P0X86_27095 [Paenibacillus sp. BR1-192]